MEYYAHKCIKVALIANISKSLSFDIRRQLHMIVRRTRSLDKTPPATAMMRVILSWI